VEEVKRKDKRENNIITVIPAQAGIQWSPKSAYFWFKGILDSGLGFGFLRRSTSSIHGVVRRNDGLEKV